MQAVTCQPIPQLSHFQIASSRSERKETFLVCLKEVQKEIMHYPWWQQPRFQNVKGFTLKFFLCDGQGTDSRTILYCDRSYLNEF